MDTFKRSSRRRGQAARATERLGEERLERNMVVRCSDELYRVATEAARGQRITLSDYVRSLIIRDVGPRLG